MILNKRDNLDIAQVHLFAREFPEALQISTRDPADIALVIKTVRDLLTKDLEEETLFVRYDDKKGLVGEIRRVAAVKDEKYEADGVRFTIRTHSENLAALKKRIAE